MPDAGDVFWVPREVSLAADPKDRRHVLAHGCDAADEEAIATLFYASSQPTQASYGARYLVVPARPEPLLDGTPANGFTVPTYVYPGAPVPVPASELTDSVGRLDDAERATLRGILADAIGAGTGTCWSARPTMRHAGVLYIAGRRAESLRGMLVTFADELIRRLRGNSPDEDVRFGIVVSRHEISAHPESFQVIVLVVADFEPLDPAELQVESETWIGDLADGARRALVLVREAFYVHPSALRPTRHQRVVGATTMRRIEDALLERWTL